MLNPLVVPKMWSKHYIPQNKIQREHHEHVVRFQTPKTGERFKNDEYIN